MTEEIFKTHGIKALVVDDNEVNILVVVSMLNQFNIETEEAVSGKDAIEKAKRTDYDIIFMDYLMPEMNGIEATQEIRRLGKVKRPVIVALSANVTQDMKHDFETAGVDDVMAKPMELACIIEILKRWMPLEKLQDYERDHTKSETAKESMKDELSEINHIFSKVKSLNVHMGLRHIGNNTENYIKVLKASIGNIQLTVKRLKMLNDAQTQVSSMKIDFHSMKGALVNIGANELSAQSNQLEIAAGNNDVQYINEKLEDYIRKLEEFSNQLEMAMKEYGALHGYEEDVYQPMKEEEFFAILNELNHALECYEFNYLEEMSEHLLKASKGEIREKLLQISKMIQSFQYEEALELLIQVEEMKKMEHSSKNVNCGTEEL